MIFFFKARFKPSWLQQKVGNALSKNSSRLEERMLKGVQVYYVFQIHNCQGMTLVSHIREQYI